MTHHPPPLLEISRFSLRHQATGIATPILQDISTSLSRGEVLGVIGESGAGKSTLGSAVIGLLPPNFEVVCGSIMLDGSDLTTLSQRAWDALRGRRIAAIFQDPAASLDPLMTIGAQLEEAIAASNPTLPRRDLRQRAIRLLSDVGIPEPARRFGDYPHQFSGGQRQRVVIAIALSGAPDIIIADEPTSALDATVQKQILTLLRKLVDETGVSLMLITHDMGVIADIADKIVVMRHGRVVEQGRVETILDSPEDDYTRRLLASIPSLRVSVAGESTACESVPTAAAVNSTATDILIARDISKSFVSGAFSWPFTTQQRQLALHDISIRLSRGGVTGIIGESGSGKTTLGRIIAGLETASSGAIMVDGTLHDVTRPGRKSGLLGRVQMIFQDPAMSLNPRLTIGETLREVVRWSHRPRAGGDDGSLDGVLDRLGLARSFLSRYPHQLSGGQKQRICIARALLAAPDIIVADEPTSALDVSVQAEIIALMRECVSERGISLLFISHDLALVQEMCSSVYIFRNGRIEDSGTPDHIFIHSRNPYTRSLISARSRRFTR